MKAFRLLLNILILVSIFSCSPNDPNNGLQEEFYPSGVIKSKINLKNGLKEGTTLHYDHKGRLISKAEYKNGLKNGKLINYNAETGKPILEANFIDDVQSGLVIQYYIEGMLFRESYYKDGRVNGIIKTYWPDGKLKAENKYSMGRPGLGLKEFDKNGKIVDQPQLIIKNLGNLNKALEIRLKGEFENANFYVGELDSIYFPNDSRKLRSENGLAYYNYMSQRNPGKISIIAKVTTNYGNTLILQKSVKP